MPWPQKSGLQIVFIGSGGGSDGVCENFVDRYTDFGQKRPRLGDGTTLTTVAPVNSKQR